jgi:hypothetical protein
MGAVISPLRCSPALRPWPFKIGSDKRIPIAWTFCPGRVATKLSLSISDVDMTHLKALFEHVMHDVDVTYLESTVVQRKAPLHAARDDRSLHHRRPSGEAPTVRPLCSVPVLARMLLPPFSLSLSSRDRSIDPIDRMRILLILLILILLQLPSRRVGHARIRNAAGSSAALRGRHEPLAGAEDGPRARTLTR